MEYSKEGTDMDKGYIENGFIVDVSNASKTSEIIYELSRILDLPDAQSKRVCLKLGSVDLSITELTSIKALVESMNSEIEFVSTSSDVTIKSAQEMDIEVSVLENKVPTPEFNADQEKVNKELEKALDKIFGDDGTEIKTFGHADDVKSEVVEPIQEVEENVQEIENVNFQRMETIETPEVAQVEEVVENPQEEIDVEEKSEDLEKFNDALENANKIEGDEIEEIDFDLDDVRKALRETEKLPTLYIQRTLRSGQSISSDGNIVIIGDANPGSEIIAKGDITVWGVLGGIAHAGSAGNQYARIRALKMNAIQLRIADVFARRPDSANIPYIQKSDTFVPEEACIRKKQIFIHKIHE
jgi:septum site-determining protein MinC